MVLGPFFGFLACEVVSLDFWITKGWALWRLKRLNHPPLLCWRTFNKRSASRNGWRVVGKLAYGTCWGQQWLLTTRWWQTKSTGWTAHGKQCWWICCLVANHTVNVGIFNRIISFLVAKSFEYSNLDINHWLNWLNIKFFSKVAIAWWSYTAASIALWPAPSPCLRLLAGVSIFHFLLKNSCFMWGRNMLSHVFSLLSIWGVSM